MSNGLRGADLRWLIDLLLRDGDRRADRLITALKGARRLCDQVKIDLSTAHAEICKLQNLDAGAHSWPDWSPQANTLRWLDDEIIPQIDAALRAKDQS